MAKVLAPFSPSLARPFGFPTGWKFTLGIVFAAQLFSAVGFSMVFPFLPLYVESLSSRFALSTEVLAGFSHCRAKHNHDDRGAYLGSRGRPIRTQEDDTARHDWWRSIHGIDGFRSERGTVDTVTCLTRHRHGYSICKQCFGSGKIHQGNASDLPWALCSWGCGAGLPLDPW